MNEGRIVQIGSPEEIYDFPKTRFAAEFIGETNIFQVKPAEGGNGQCLIEEAGVSFPASELGALAGGGSAHLSLRPEKIVRLGAEADNRYVQLEAVVSELVFLGDVVRYTARLPGGAAISFKEHRTGSSGMLAVDERVRLGFQPGDAVLLAESGGATAS